MTSNHTPINGAALLDEVEAFHRRFNAFPTEHAYTAVTLWDAHAHLLDSFDVTPRLAFLSPAPAVGKSRALDVVGALTPNPMNAVASAAAYGRVLSGPGRRPTLLLDEADTACDPRTDAGSELCGFLNTGHRADGVIYQSEAGADASVRKYAPYAAVALAGLGFLPDTLTARSIVIRMHRAAPGTRLEPFRPSKHAAEGTALRERLAAWADTVASHLGRPRVPSEVTLRQAAVWEPLLAVAEAAGSGWPERARTACTTLADETNEGRHAA
ncbi:DUF3631 domain-containing protein [Streptomyces sp. NBC_00356]|uniref:DUF3631 domain-containing protein n=1 Tax=Streptomyces sp. NBC_00356 TaxID=2975724 RepID=UPI002E25E964